jgi:hypothetical protein
MKQKIVTLFLLLPFIFTGLSSFSQCEPATPEQCPDPDNNGAICPDTLAVGYAGQPYSQVATIVSPQVYIMNDTTEIALHHIVLQEIGNLPPGYSWQTNAPDNIFMAGGYYCSLISGTTDSAGEYALRIVVDVYAVVFPGLPPIKVATAVDSTSLTLVVIDNSGIKENANSSFYVRQNIPNPFQSETRIEYYSEKPGTVTFEVYSMFGEKIYTEKLNAARGENSLVFNGRMLPKGSYFFILRSESFQANEIMIRAD